MPEAPEASLPHFSLPGVLDNSSGWGPNVSTADCGIPFAPFNKNDRLGRISDWTQNGNMNRRGRGRFPQQFGMGMGQFQYRHEDDESSFSLVDNKVKPKQRFGRRVFRPNWNNNRRNNRGWRGRGNWRGRGGRGRGGGRYGNNGRNNYYNNRYRYGDRTPDIKDPSVDVQEDWKLLATLEFADLEKASYRHDGQAKNLRECGALEGWNPNYDSVTPQKTKNLRRFENCQFFTASTSEDPVIQELAEAGEGNVYATDTILSALMAATRSVISWDVVVRKENGNIYFDKRLDSKLDFLTVNENWNEIQQTDKDSVNHPVNLSREATLINHNFSQQVLSKDNVLPCKEPNPFESAVERGMVASSVAYHYRKFEMENGISLVARCSVNGFCQRQGKKYKMVARALNEFDSKLSGYVDWRQKLKDQTGAVLANELKNNHAKLARWTAELLLSGAEELRLGFVSRVYPKDSSKHVILMTKRYEPNAFARSINVKAHVLWGVLKTIIETVKEQQDGTFLLLKDPNKTELQLYEIPEDAFGEEEQ